MCATCGCGGTARIRLVTAAVPAGQPAHDAGQAPGDHEHGDHEYGDHEYGDHAYGDHGQAGHAHGQAGHTHGHGDHGHERTVVLQEKILAKNDALARANRDWLRRRGVLAVNLMSSPGAGKTTLLERTARHLGLPLSVIEGDQETALDARRISAAGSQVVQINTGVGCHLDAEMVAGALRTLDPAAGSVVVIENVGNLVCPALFDLGEGARVVLSSVTEGADKPAKYPHMFRRAGLVLVTKTDLLPYVEFDLARHAADVRKLSPATEMIQVSASTGAGMADWYGWLRARLSAAG